MLVSLVVMVAVSWSGKRVLATLPPEQGLTNEPIANRSFSSLDELEEVLFERCEKLLNLKELIRGLTNFHWWPEALA